MCDGEGVMPDGNEAEPTPTADQQIDGQVNMVNVVESLPFVGGMARMAYVSGGGGEGGHFAISSLEELDVFIGRWENIRDRIQTCGDKLDMALQHVQPPADDRPSEFEANATRDSLKQARRHNEAMRVYTQGYVDKLRAARKDYAGTEGDNAAHINQSDG